MISVSMFGLAVPSLILFFLENGISKGSCVLTMNKIGFPLTCNVKLCCCWKQDSRFCVRVAVTGAGYALSGNNGASSGKTVTVPYCPRAHHYHFLILSPCRSLPVATPLSQATDAPPRQRRRNRVTWFEPVTAPLSTRRQGQGLS